MHLSFCKVLLLSALTGYSFMYAQQIPSYNPEIPWWQDMASTNDAVEALINGGLITHELQQEQPMELLPFIDEASLAPYPMLQLLIKTYHASSETNYVPYNPLPNTNKDTHKHSPTTRKLKFFAFDHSTKKCISRSGRLVAHELEQGQSMEFPFIDESSLTLLQHLTRTYKDTHKYLPTTGKLKFLAFDYLTKTCKLPRIKRINERKEAISTLPMQLRSKKAKIQ